MSYSTHLVKLQKNKNGTLFSVLKDANGSNRTAFVPKKQLDNDSFYISPEEGAEYVALVQHTDNGTSFIQQLLHPEFLPLGKALSVDVYYDGVLLPVIQCFDRSNNLVLKLTKKSDKNYKKIRYCAFNCEQFNVRFYFTGEAFELEVEKDIEESNAFGDLYDMRIQGNKEQCYAIFKDESKRSFPVNFPRKLLNSLPFFDLPSQLHDVAVTFDHDNYWYSLSFERTKAYLVSLIKDKEHTFSVLSCDDDTNERSYLRLDVDIYSLEVLAWRSDLVRLGIDIEALDEGDTIKGKVKSRITDDGRLFINFVLTECQEYEGWIKIDRSFEKNGIKHFVFTKLSSDGSQFVIKQPEFFTHGIIDFFEPQGQCSVSIYEFQENEKSPREWKVKHVVPCWLNGKKINQDIDNGHCSFEGVLVHDWYARNKEVFSPFGKVNRNFHHYALRNHAVCEVVMDGQAQMVLIPSSLLKAKGLIRIEAGTSFKGVARYVLLDIFHVGHRGWLADNVEVVENDKDARALPKLHESQVEILKFVCEEPSQYKVRVYTFASLDDEQTFRFNDYSKQMESIPEPERYHFIVKTQPRGQFINVREILSAELQP
ncbi:hypothetical protein LMJ53_15505 [Rheinheimera sp. UJ51]|uniref:hypothetical protein n=1 Tax=Rheinheimera sp. UJ51 TaxID=2892446 RepID=UPI001E5E696D|nr:hypothetical protein [Rheinheimera sp. UJ51]MCC5453128.1 hypothetical protein [Rheinheimera sp. UJ51]